MSNQQESTKARVMAPVIAVIGCDGSGKSTVSEQILHRVGRCGPAVRAHLGKQSGNIGRALARWPLIGHAMDRLIARKTDAVHDHMASATQPGVLSALVISGFTMRRMHRFRRMLALRRRGFIVVTDRYPQLEHPGTYDGPELTVTTRGNPVVRWLARREHARFAWMASYRPDLVLRLNVDLETACARKPDHRRELLRRKVVATPLLTFNGAPIVDIDATRPLNDVLAAAAAAVDELMVARGYTLQGKVADVAGPSA